ncbi:RNA-directed DNA polymerase [Terasakiella sp.]|uniref:RNA-directed DNA polymerase n=1 Tax=Terasakiella sp. TaxID=2034861 RepID=UPI003AA845CA
MSSLKLDVEVVRWTIRHLVKFGDTDIFPYPLELQFFEEMSDEIAEEISKINLYNYRPLSPLETLAPKSKLGFRIAHQLHPFDALILTSIIVTIGEDLENNRLPINQGEAYSYRFEPTEGAALFVANNSYRNWLHEQWVSLIFGSEYSHVVVTDIADYYQRIYHHRLENQLLEYTNNSAFAKTVVRILKDLRIRESFGRPVGGNASRLLAEIAINDVDHALISEGYHFTRYVDDFRLFITEGDDPYTALAFLAQTVTSEGLSLSAMKTKILTKEEYLQELKMLSGEDKEQAKESATELLFWQVYQDEETDEEALAALQQQDLIGELTEELDKHFWDVQKIRVHLRALRMVKTDGAANFVKQHFRTLLPFVKDIVLLMDELKNEEEETFDDFADEVIKVLLEPTAQKLPLVRAWLLELFVRDVLPINATQLRQLSALNETLDLRQIYRLRKKVSDLMYFRRSKARIDEQNGWMQPAFIHGASCLPDDEFETWINNIKNRVNFPLSELFCKWVLKTK